MSTATVRKTRRLPWWAVASIAVGGLVIAALVFSVGRFAYFTVNPPAAPPTVTACQEAVSAKMGGAVTFVTGDAYLIAGDSKDGRYAVSGSVEFRQDGAPERILYSCEVRQIGNERTVTRVSV